MLRNFVLTLCLANLPFLHADAIRQTLQNAHAHNSVLLFYTTWCPACQKAVLILNTVQQRYPQKVKVLGVNLDDGIARKNYLEDTAIGFETLHANLEDVSTYDVQETVPVIYVLDTDLQIIKRYLKVPNQTLFMQLIERVQAGYLENGTLPIEERIDLWQRKRN
jgi:thiol-disulfide isomerase/thioredoxin